jgi:hypothetical protein
MDGVSVSKSEWTLSAEALARFLVGLDPDYDRAGEKYENLRLTLMKFFDWRGAHFPEETKRSTASSANLMKAKPSATSLHIATAWPAWSCSKS